MRKLVRTFSMFAIFSIVVLFMQMAAAYLSLYYKGHVFESLVREGSARESIFRGALLFAFFHIFAAISKSFIDFLTDNYALWRSEEKWRKHFPERISIQKVDQYGSFYHSLSHLVPRAATLERTTMVALSFSVISYLIYVVMVVRDNFLPGLLFLFCSVGFSFLSGQFLQKRLNRTYTALDQHRVGLMGWLESFFKGSLERQSGWMSGQQSRNWYHQMGATHLERGLVYENLKFFKNLAGNLFIDVPYFCFAILVIYFALQQNMPLSKVVIWLGLAEYVVIANGSLAQYLTGRKELSNLNRIIDENLDSDIAPVRFAESTSPTVKQFSFALRNGSEVQLSIETGLHLIAGPNGSGKSSLLHALTGYSDEYYDWDVSVLTAIQKRFKGKARFLDPHGILYPQGESLAQQIASPFSEQSREEVMMRVGQRLSEILPQETAAQWKERARVLDGKWTEGYLPSAGERALLAFFRFVYGFDESVELIMVDEGDSALDRETRQLWIRTFKSLAQTKVIYMVTHNLAPAAPPVSWVTSGHFLGYSSTSQAGKVVDFQLTATSRGRGNVVGLGNVGQTLQDELKLSLSALCHSHPDYYYLRNMDFQIYSHDARLKIEEVSSASLALALALDNIFALSKGQKPLLNLAATGRILADGSVHDVGFLQPKLEAAKASRYIQVVISPQDLTHLCDWPALKQKIATKGNAIA